MEALLVFLFIIAIILLISVLSKMSAQGEIIRSLDQSIRDLSDQVFKLWLEKKQSPLQEKFQVKEEQPPIVEPAPEIIVEKEEAPRFVPLRVSVEEPQNSKIVETQTSEPKPALVDEPSRPAQPGFWETFLKNNPELERFISENIANKIGIGVLALGISFYVKYAIDRDQISEVGRVIIGLLAGGL